MRLYPALTMAALAFATIPTSAQALQAPPDVSGPGVEHERFVALAGEWTVRMAPGSGGPDAAWVQGEAMNEPLLDGRFLQTSVSVPGGLVPEAIYTLAFDRRHGRYDVILMDNSGTYFVTARGVMSDDARTVTMYGVDDDPFMASLGFEKAFVLEYRFISDDEFEIQTRFVDTRTEARTEQAFVTLSFAR